MTTKPHGKDHKTTPQLDTLIAAYRATGRLVFIYPRLKALSINGFARISYAEAEQQMTEFFARQAKQA
jgi:hypothetical protein